MGESARIRSEWNSCLTNAYRKEDSPIRRRKNTLKLPSIERPYSDLTGSSKQHELLKKIPKNERTIIKSSKHSKLIKQMQKLDKYH